MDISVFRQPFQTEDRSWLLSEFEDAFTRGGTINWSLFTPATHFPNLYLPSGTALGVVTASGLLGPYDSTASDGRQTCVGLTVASESAVQYNGAARVSSGVAYVCAFAAVSVSKLPFNSTNASTGRGYVDAAAQTSLRNLYFAA